MMKRMMRLMLVCASLFCVTEVWAKEGDIGTKARVRQVRELCQAPQALNMVELDRLGEWLAQVKTLKTRCKRELAFFETVKGRRAERLVESLRQEMGPRYQASLTQTYASVQEHLQVVAATRTRVRQANPKRSPQFYDLPKYRAIKQEFEGSIQSFSRFEEVRKLTGTKRPLKPTKRELKASVKLLEKRAKVAQSHRKLCPQGKAVVSSAKVLGVLQSEEPRVQVKAHAVEESWQECWQETVETKKGYLKSTKICEVQSSLCTVESEQGKHVLYRTSVVTNPKGSEGRLVRREKLSVVRAP